jgi:hypothetical protein
MDLSSARAQAITRRHFFRNCQVGIGGMALASLLGRESSANPVQDADPLAVRSPHFAPKAKRVIYLHLAGSPPHLDLFDYKPELVKHDGKLCPDEFVKGRRFAFTSGTPKLMGTPHKFAQYGQAGVWMSDAIPHLTEVIDELAVIRSMNTDQFNHAPAELMLHTGSPRIGRPSLGSWSIYGLGSESQNLPGFIVLVSGGSNPSAGKSVWGSGFLPSVFQGVQCRSQGEPVLYVTNPAGMDQQLRRASLDALNELNRLQAAELGSEETLTRIAQYELAFRMQVTVPEVMDIARETQTTLDDYGAKRGEASFANNCLMARRLAEQGVRFVQLFDWGWDFHGTRDDSALGDGLRKRCEKMDRPVAALIKDLKARGMLDDTLVIWGGEFGRTPFREGRTAATQLLGRDHYPDCFTMFMAGGGVKPGIVYGETDELGFSVASNKVHVHDFQATVLHLLGFDHKRLTYPYQGRDFRLTDVYGEVVPALLA